MTITRTYPENLIESKKEVYLMTRGENVGKLSDRADSPIEAAAWVLTEDVDATGELRNVLSIKDQSGAVYATNSPTFISEFLYIADLMGDEAYKVQVVHGTSKNRRKFITCTLVD